MEPLFAIRRRHFSPYFSWFFFHRCSVCPSYHPSISHLPHLFSEGRMKTLFVAPIILTVAGVPRHAHTHTHIYIYIHSKYRGICIGIARVYIYRYIYVSTIRVYIPKHLFSLGSTSVCPFRRRSETIS